MNWEHLCTKASGISQSICQKRRSRYRQHLCLHIAAGMQGGIGASTNSVETGQAIGRNVLEKVHGNIWTSISSKGEMTGMTASPLVFTTIPPLFTLVGISACVLFLCLGFLLWRQSASKGPKAPPPVAKKTVIEEDDAVEDDSQKRVTVFFGTQTGTAEGFAKVSIGVMLLGSLRC